MRDNHYSRLGIMAALVMHAMYHNAKLNQMIMAASVAVGVLMPDVGAPTPRWVKVFEIVAVIVIVVFALLHLAGGGPGRHMTP
jgi:hypothetical protein